MSPKPQTGEMTRARFFLPAHAARQKVDGRLLITREPAHHACGRRRRQGNWRCGWCRRSSIDAHGHARELDRPQPRGAQPWHDLGRPYPHKLTCGALTLRIVVRRGCHAAAASGLLAGPISAQSAVTALKHHDTHLDGRQVPIQEFLGSNIGEHAFFKRVGERH